MQQQQLQHGLGPTCDTCKQQPSKYRCPACQSRTCSLQCSQQHKHDSGCTTGKRDKLAYVPLAEFTDRHLLSGDDGGEPPPSSPCPGSLLLPAGHQPSLQDPNPQSVMQSTFYRRLFTPTVRCDLWWTSAASICCPSVFPVCLQAAAPVTPGVHWFFSTICIASPAAAVSHLSHLPSAISRCCLSPSSSTARGAAWAPTTPQGR